MPLTEVTKTDSRLAARCAAVASLGAAAIHFAVMPMHWRDWVPSGVFFAGLAVFQLLWAYLAWSRPSPLLLGCGIAANAAAAGLWITSCVIGPPMGPSAGQPEAVGAAGISVLLMQCYVVMGAALAWSRQGHAQKVPGLGRALVLFGANTVMAGAVTVGVVASAQGHHHHGAVTEPHGEVRIGPAPAAVEPGLPVTDTSLGIGGDVRPDEHAAPEPDGHEHHHDD